MDELFRFNITRPVERTSADTLPIGQTNNDNSPGGGAVPFPVGDAWNDWPVLERQAFDWIVSRSAWLLSPEFQTFITEAKGLLDEMLTLSSNKVAPKKWPADFRNRFQKLAQQPDLKQWDSALAILFIALLIVRRSGSGHLSQLIGDQNVPPGLAAVLYDQPSLNELADILRFIAVLQTNPAALDKLTWEDVLAAMTKTILLPPGIFAGFEKPVHAAGWADLYLVKQHIHHYELGEIARVENILKGETRSHKQKHFLSNETQTTILTENITETDEELTTTDHVNMRNEVENTIKADTKVDGGLHIQYEGAAYNAQTDLTGAYDQSSNRSQKSATEISKDVTQKSAKKVTQRVQQSETIKIIETFEENEEQAFDNKGGAAHISGIYQWVEKVYLAQVFNYGRHLLFDIMVPEPAAALLAAATVPSKSQKLPVPPPPLQWLSFLNQPPRPVENDDDLDKLIHDGAILHDLTPDDINPDESDPGEPPLVDYTRWISQYQVTGVEPSPDRFISVGKTFSRDRQGGQEIAVEDEIKIPDGYQALTATAEATWKHSSGDDENGTVIVHIDDTVVLQAVESNPTGSTVGATRTDNFSGGDADQHVFYVNRQFRDLTVDADHNPRAPVMGAAAIAVSGANIDEASVGVEVRCERMVSALRKWQLTAYEAIATAWQKRQADYEDKTAAMQFQDATLGPLGAADPDTNRQIERTELKRACIAILDNDNATVRGVNAALQPWPSPPPDPPDPTNPVLPEPILADAEEIGAKVRWFEQAFEWDKIGYIFYPYFWGRRSEWIKQLNLKNDDSLFLNFLQAGYARVVIPVRSGFELAVNYYLYTGQPWLGGDVPGIGVGFENPLYLSITEELKEQTGAPGDEKPVGDPWYIRLPTTLIKLRKDDKTPTWVRVPTDTKPPDDPWTWKEGTPET